MIRVVLIGAGNVAINLAGAMQKTETVELIQYFSRTDRNDHYFPDSISRAKDLDTLEDADVYLIAVKDEAIEQVASRLFGKKGLILHTSGSIPLKALGANPRRGVLYPVQTFSKDRKLDWKKIPLALETSSGEDMTLLRELASQLSNHIWEIDSKKRKKLHLAAVFANNFSNHMFALAQELCQENQLDFDLVKPLIEETGSKVMTISPEEAQTGPARRHDLSVLADQSGQLDSQKEEIYNLISKSIASRYPKIN